MKRAVSMEGSLVSNEFKRSVNVVIEERGCLVRL